jgi:hypothetical protein
MPCFALFKCILQSLCIKLIDFRGRIHNTSFSLQLTNWPNKLEFYMTLVKKKLARDKHSSLGGPYLSYEKMKCCGFSKFTAWCLLCVLHRTHLLQKVNEFLKKKWLIWDHHQLTAFLFWRGMSQLPAYWCLMSMGMNWHHAIIIFLCHFNSILQFNHSKSDLKKVWISKAVVVAPW